MHVRTIGRYAFRNSHSLIMLHISRTIRSIGLDAIAYIQTLSEVSFDPYSELKSIGRGFIYMCAIHSIFIPPTVSSIGNHFLADNNIEDLFYCSKKEVTCDFVFHGTKGYSEPKRIHVLSNYKYQKIGNHSNLLKDGFCERMTTKITCRTQKTNSVFFKCQILFILTLS